MKLLNFKLFYRTLRKKSPTLYCWLYVFRFIFGCFRNFGWKAKLIKKTSISNKPVIILGSGQTYWDFKDDYLNGHLSGYTTIGISRTIYDDFIPDIYLTEISDTQLGRKWLNHLAEILHDKQIEYQHVPILVKNCGQNKSFKQYILKKFPNSLKSNVLFTNEFLAPHGTNIIARSFLASRFLTRLIWLTPAAIQCRSTTYMATLLSFELGASKVILAGVDGIGGYFFESLPNNKKYLDFHKKFIGVDKNPLGNSGIHSVANVNSGKPTVTRLMIETNKFIGPIYLISQKSILSKWLEVYKCT